MSIFRMFYVKVKFNFQYKIRHQLISACIQDLFELFEIPKLFQIPMKKLMMLDL